MQNKSCLLLFFCFIFALQTMGPVNKVASLFFVSCYDICLERQPFGPAKAIFFDGTHSSTNPSWDGTCEAKQQPVALALLPYDVCL